MGRMIAVEVTDMTYTLLLLYQLSYLAILPPITVKHLNKVFGLNFTPQRENENLLFELETSKQEQQ